MKLYPAESIRIELPMQGSEALDCLAKNTDPHSSGWSITPSEKRFAGKVHAGDIKIQRIIQYRNLFAPVLAAKLDDLEDACMLSGTLKISGMVLAITSFLVIALALYSAATFASGGAWQTPLLAIFFIYALAQGGFWLEVKPLQQSLHEALQQPC